MSTILDALRKVERETAQRVQEPSSPPDNSLARVLAEKRNKNVFRRLVIVITLLFLAGAGVMFTFGHKIFPPKDKAPAPRVAAVPAKKKDAPPPVVPVKQREEASKPPQVVKKPVPEPEKPVKKEEPAPVPPKKEETVLAETSKALQTPVPQIPPRASSPVQARRSETVIPDLDLQAIVWSDDPKSCSAMINGRLVRLGEEIGGFTVDEIGRNYVYVTSGLRSGKLRMIGSR